MKIQKIFLFVIFLIACRTLTSQKDFSGEKDCLKVSNIWLNETINLTKNCVGYSAPVAARSFAYFGIGLYECSVENVNGAKSLSEQLQNYNRKVWKSDKDVIYWPYVLNVFCFEFLKVFYKNMPPSNLKKIEAINDSIYRRHRTKISNKIMVQSDSYGKKFTAEFIGWAEMDGGRASYNFNYPLNYNPPSCNGCWTPTVPAYLPALQPYWGQNRLFLVSNHSVCDSIIPLEYSKDTASFFYKEARALFDLYKYIDKDKEVIAEYWDDSPGYSGTPTGHLFSIALQLSKSQKFSLQKSMQLYALLGIVINDAFIECWRLKFQYHLIRPITYIHREISPDFNTIIPSPPFPEFPSGHSFQSGAGAEVLMHFFSDSLSFIDSTNINRHDIQGKPRKFKNFSEMAAEISISRFYGGIHFMYTLNESLKFGKLIGRNSIHNIRFTE